MSARGASARRHVAHVLSSLQLGGQERVALALAASQVRSGYRVTVLSLAPPPDGPLGEEFRGVGVEVAHVPRPRPGVDPLLYLRLARWFSGNGADLVHTHNRMALIYGAPAARLARVPIVHTKHGKNPKGGTRLWAGKLAACWVDAFVAVSEETAAFARRRREVDERRLLTIPNGVDLERFRPDPAARRRVRAELGLDAEAWVAGTVGRLAVEKNQRLLLNATAPLLGQDARLVIAGDGPLLEDLRRHARVLRIDPYVHFLGARRDVPDVLNAIDAFVLCSNLEGLPLVIPEAMATGLPVVSTDVGGIPGVVEEGHTGFLVPAGDERALRDRLVKLQTDRQTGRAFGERGRRFASERLSAGRMEREYLALYERVLSGKQRRHAAPS